MRQSPYPPSQLAFQSLCLYHLESRAIERLGLWGRWNSALRGEVSEWLKEQRWKRCVRVTVPRVRIPPSPPVCSKRSGCQTISTVFPWFSHLHTAISTLQFLTITDAAYPCFRRILAFLSHTYDRFASPARSVNLQKIRSTWGYKLCFTKYCPRVSEALFGLRPIAVGASYVPTGVEIPRAGYYNASTTAAGTHMASVLACLKRPHRLSDSGCITLRQTAVSALEAVR
jgi:hypothetical protein